MRSPPACAALAAVAAGLVCAGCGQKTEECNLVIGRINASIEGANQEKLATDDPKAIAAGIRKLADSSERVANDLDATKLATAELVPHVTDYQKMARDRARLTRDWAAAVEKVEIDKLEGFEKQMKDLVKRESDIVARLNQACGAPGAATP